MFLATSDKLILISPMRGYLILSLRHTAGSSSVHTLHAAILCLWGWKFRFWDYFQLVARCIVQACAGRSYTMSSAHIIVPKWQQWSGRHSSCLAVCFNAPEDSWFLSSPESLPPLPSGNNDALSKPYGETAITPH